MNRRFRPTPSAASIPAPSGRVRIIGGRWRGTRLDVFDAPGLRPTSDRVRETLFNWLMPVLPGAHVLDLFAGSGALGLEALSRGAASALLVERDARQADALRATVARLQGGEAARVAQADALGVLRASPTTRFDIAFVDPPFDAGLWRDVFDALPAHMADDAMLYVEAPHDRDDLQPIGWAPHREGRTREVRFALYRRTGSGPGFGAATLPPVAPDGASC